jgi:hypothetical protein
MGQILVLRGFFIYSGTVERWNGMDDRKVDTVLLLLQVTSVSSAVPPRDVAEELYQSGMFLAQLFGGRSEETGVSKLQVRSLLFT